MMAECMEKCGLTPEWDENQRLTNYPSGNECVEKCVKPDFAHMEQDNEGTGNVKSNRANTYDGIVSE